MTGEFQTTRLNTNSYISIGLGVAVVGAVVGGFGTMNVWLGGKFDAQNEKLMATNSQLTQITYDMKQLQQRLDRIEGNKAKDPWVGVDMFKWAVKLQRDNPQIKVPEPKHESEAMP